MANIHELGQNWGGVRPEFSARIDRDVLHKSHELVEVARQDAIERSGKSPEAITRIESALRNRFFPYVLENETIAKQITSPEYEAKVVRPTNEYLEVRHGIVVCPDGRILAVALADPRVTGIHRRLRGMPDTRSSTKHGEQVLDDPDLAAAITTDIQERLETGQPAELVEGVGGHIQSGNPEHGCGAAAGLIAPTGSTLETGMKFGGIEQYFKDLGDGFFAFDNDARVAGGIGTTFDLVHDAYSQGFIVGLRDVYDKFNPQFSLRENLLRLASERKILMTEQLDDVLSQDIFDLAERMGSVRAIDVRDFTRFAENMILINGIAREISARQETQDFPFIPDSIKDGKSKNAVRVIGYDSVRNTVYRVLGNFSHGRNPLTRHPEQLIRFGPIGADFNVANIPFIQSTPEGRIGPEDIAGVSALYNLSYGVLKEQGVDLTREGRVIVTTGIFDPNGESSKNRAAFNKASGVVQNNAAWIRIKFQRGIESGETIVIGGLHKPGNREFTHIV